MIEIKQKDWPKYLLTLGIVILSFGIVGSIPMFLAVQNIENQGFEISKTSELQDYVGLNTFFIYLLIPFITAFLSLLACIKYIHQKTIKSIFTSREFFDWKRFFFSFSVWGSIMFVFFVVSYYYAGYPIVFNFKPVPFFILVLISLFILPIQTTFEELFFRGYLFKCFDSIFKYGFISIVITGLLFGLMHGANPEVEKIGLILLVFYILNGFFLGLIVRMDEGLELTMGYHAINNIFAAIIVTNDWQAFHTDALFIDQSPPSFGIENIITLLFIQPLLILLFAKKYKWKNWKSKLWS